MAKLTIKIELELRKIAMRVEEKLLECHNISEYLERSESVVYYNHFVIGVYIVRANNKFNSEFVLWAETHAKNASVQIVRKNVYVIQVNVYGDL